MSRGHACYRFGMADSTAEVFSAAKFTLRAAQTGVTWKELASRLEVHRTTLGAVRSGRSAPSTELLVKMVEVLGGTPEDYLDLPERPSWTLKLFRMVAGYTQHAVSEALGVAPAAVSGWETGRYKPPRSVVPKLAKMYRASEAELEAAVSRHGEVAPTEALVLCAESVVRFAEVALEAVAAMPAASRRARSALVREQLEVSMESLSSAVRELPDESKRARLVGVVRRLAELHASAEP
ncbi:transcriptional regulator [Mycolicibacterium sp. GF69]|jgi:transcriptional regulator with XRE-family HTH domain|uniref:HTH cro/C1-type domain-containing protein n=2 Tax=Mycolicibacterium TaxID=1866885 RepID=A0A5S9P9T4_MYCVN|nr:transcriptional regulator [Mycolicibacterium sp. GF69]CAA0100293.1 Uncharacterised protein [Mycolicibacterium vanbaalenii]